MVKHLFSMNFRKKIMISALTTPIPHCPGFPVQCYESSNINWRHIVSRKRNRTISFKENMIVMEKIIKNQQKATRTSQ